MFTQKQVVLFFFIKNNIMKHFLLFTLCILTVQTNAQIEVSTLTTTFKGSGGVTIDQDGNVYIGDFGDFLGGPDTDGIPNNVMRLDTDLNLTIFANDFTGASGNEFDASGVLYQADIRDNAVYKIVGGSRELYTSTGLVLPVGIAFDSSGNLFVCNCGTSTIRKITAAGVSTEFSTGAGLLACPNGMTIDENDNLYVVNFSNPFVVKIEPDGTVTNIGETDLGNGHIDYDQNTKNLYIASFGGNQLFYLNTLTLNFGLLAGTGDPGNTDGAALGGATFSAPNGIAVSKTGDSIYVNSSATLDNSNLNPQYVRLLTNVLSLSTEEYEIPDAAIKAYPNPTLEQLIIESTYISSIPDLSITVLDISGKSVKKVDEFDSSDQSTLVIDVSSLHSGMFFYTINKQNKTLYRGKFIKK